MLNADYVDIEYISSVNHSPVACHGYLLVANMRLMHSDWLRPCSRDSTAKDCCCQIPCPALDSASSPPSELFTPVNHALSRFLATKVVNQVSRRRYSSTLINFFEASSPHQVATTLAGPLFIPFSRHTAAC